MDDDVNFYLNWVLCAVLGKLGEADWLVRHHGDAIRRVADALAKHLPIERKPLYRGVLVDPAHGHDDKSFQFVSWSEDRNVARWFGSLDSYISEPFAQIAPEARGFVLTLDKTRNPTVLFHHSWMNAFGRPLEAFALAMGSGDEGIDYARQIQWSLRTQREVITAPLAVMPTPERTELLEGPSMKELDERLAPPWVRGEDGGFFVMMVGGKT